MNYQGISLLNCAVKIFTTIIKLRILVWAEENCLIPRSQSAVVTINWAFGFSMLTIWSPCRQLLANLLTVNTALFSDHEFLYVGVNFSSNGKFTSHVVEAQRKAGLATAAIRWLLSQMSSLSRNCEYSLFPVKICSRNSGPPECRAVSSAALQEVWCEIIYWQAIMIAQQQNVYGATSGRSKIYRIRPMHWIPDCFWQPRRTRHPSLNSRESRLALQVVLQNTLFQSQ